MKITQPCRGRRCAALSFPIAEQFPYSGGPGMPGPYNSINIGSLLFIKYLLQ